MSQKIELEKTVGYLFPEKISLFKNKEDAFNSYPYSHKKFLFICPECGREKEMTVDNAIHRNFFCKYCNDKVSMPNKMLRDICGQLKENNIIEDFDLEYIIKESGLLYRYDAHFFYNNIEYFIEAHGSQHKDVRSFKYSGETTKKRDKAKEDYIRNKENSELIVIWCDKDDFEYRKNNFIKEFNEIGIDLNKIDWLRVEKSLVNNLLKEICEYYNNHQDIPLYKIGEEFKITQPVITSYLERGTKIGFCNFDTHKHKVKLFSMVSHAPKVLVYNSKKELLYIFSNQAKAANNLSKIYNKKFLASSICTAIRRNNRYNNLIFRNIDNPIKENEILNFEKKPENSKLILVYNLNNELLYKFNSIAEASMELTKIYNKLFLHGNISDVILKKTYYYKDLYFTDENNPLSKDFIRELKTPKNIIRVLVYDNKGNFLYEFKNQVEAVQKMSEMYNMNFTKSGVNACIKKKIKTHLGFIFRYINDPL